MTILTVLTVLIILTVLISLLSIVLIAEVRVLNNVFSITVAVGTINTITLSSWWRILTVVIISIPILLRPIPTSISSSIIRIKRAIERSSLKNGGVGSITNTTFLKR